MDQKGRVHTKEQVSLHSWINMNMSCMGGFSNLNYTNLIAKCTFNLYFNLHLFIRTVYVSFGGLLMSIFGSIQNLGSYEIDSNVYLLLKKI
jgi:hypothetical protein